jgi:hypothetical protein
MLRFYRFRARAVRLALFSAAATPMFLMAPQPAVAQLGGVDLDTIQAGRFDYGKMWTFEYAPASYFSETYGFDANPEWFERARLSVLRIPGCSASFVSPHGLVATNHHCVRGRVAGLSGEGEDLLSDGFVARTLADERRIPGYYADQLIQVQDISEQVFAVADAASDEDRDAARSQVVEEIQAQLKAEHASGGDSIWVQVIGLYNGGRYSAYVFRRFTDVRLVVAAEVEMGFFGGDPDNFTYPRYDLDFSFLRVYEDDRPYQPAHYFGWGAGVEPGDEPPQDHRAARIPARRLRAGQRALPGHAPRGPGGLPQGRSGGCARARDPELDVRSVELAEGQHGPSGGAQQPDDHGPQG